MNDSNKAVRKLLYKDLTFLGTSDWAVDLQSEDGDSSSSGSSGGGTVYIDPGIWSSASLLVTAIPGMTLIWPPKPLPTPTTISFPLWTTTVSYSSLTTLTSTLTNGVTSTYPWYIYVSIFTTISIPTGGLSSYFNACPLLTLPAVVTSAIPVWAVTLSTNTTGGPIYLTSSVQPPPFGITITP
jgi:chitinase